MNTAALRDKIKPRKRVRLRAGALVSSTRKSLGARNITRPYWVSVFSLSEDGQRIIWLGSANYITSASIDDVDRVEDHGDE